MLWAVPPASSVPCGDMAGIGKEVSKQTWEPPVGRRVRGSSFASRIDSRGVIALGVSVTRSDLEKQIEKWTF